MFHGGHFFSLPTGPNNHLQIRVMNWIFSSWEPVFAPTPSSKRQLFLMSPALVRVKMLYLRFISKIIRNWNYWCFGNVHIKFLVKTEKSSTHTVWWISSYTILKLHANRAQFQFTITNKALMTASKFKAILIFSDIKRIMRLGEAVKQEDCNTFWKFFVSCSENFVNKPVKNH